MTAIRKFLPTTTTLLAICTLAACGREQPRSPEQASMQAPAPVAATPAPVIPPPAPAPDPEQDVATSLADLGATESPRGFQVRLTNAKFPSGATSFEPTDPTRIEKIAGILESHPDMHALIEGFTDSRGSEHANETVSQKRAESVRQALIQRGIDASRLLARGVGESRPIADNATQEGRDQNRRVEILFSNREGRFAAAADARPSG